MPEAFLHSFNPYFTGLPILIMSSNVSAAPSDCFNPYFTGLPILILTTLGSPYVLIRFQSLFYWITYSYTTEYYNLDMLQMVLILILLDYLFLFLGILWLKEYKEWFQSLFYWITYSYKINFDLQGNIGKMFQSLFYWITYSYYKVTSVN